MRDASLLVKPTDNLPRGLETDRSSTGIKLPREPLHFRHLILTTLIRIHRSVPKGSDDPRSGPLKRHRSAIRCLVHPQRPLANSKSPHNILVEFHIEQIEDIPSDQEPVSLCRNRMEDPVKDLRRTEYVSELGAAFHPEEFSNERSAIYSVVLEFR